MVHMYIHIYIYIYTHVLRVIMRIYRPPFRASKVRLCVREVAKSHEVTNLAIAIRVHDLAS